MAWAFDDAPVNCVAPRYFVPNQDIEHHIKNGYEVHAHNAAFEFQIWNNIFYPDVPLRIEQMTCTMAMAYAMGLPGNLAGAAAALGIEQQKDMEGSRLMLQMCKPREVKENGDIVWWMDDEKLKRLMDYCIQDVVVEREVGKRMMALSPYEKKVWLLDQKINSRGITVDRLGVTNALKLVEIEKDRLDVQMREVTQGMVATCNAVQQIKDHLEFYGVSEESLNKADVTALLEKEDLHPHARSVLELRTQGGKAATAKLEPMLMKIGEDDRLKGCFQYSGANTRRWAGRGVQLHNLKRPGMKHEHIETVVRSIREGFSAFDIDLFFGPPLTILSDCTRAFLTAARNEILICCDFASIEPRVLAWLAGQDNVLDIFRNREDIYLIQAGQIFRKPITDKNDPRRQIGKVAILALGYAGGVGAFHMMAKAYNVKMAPAFFDLWGAADAETKDSALQRYQSAGKKYEISKEEFLASEVTKIMWRKANPEIVNYWHLVEDAFLRAILNPGQSFVVGHEHRAVQFKKVGSFMWCRLPSGGVICYPYPEIKATKTPWGATKDLPTYMAEDGQTHKWQRFSTYGGSIVENITQAVARDLLADAMLRLDAKGYPIVLHVHDEIVCELPIGQGSLNEMQNIMSENPSWAFDLPLDASGWQGFRYRK